MGRARFSDKICKDGEHVKVPLTDAAFLEGKVLCEGNHSVFEELTTTFTAWERQVEATQEVKYIDPMGQEYQLHNAIQMLRQI